MAKSGGLSGMREFEAALDKVAAEIVKGADAATEAGAAAMETDMHALVPVDTGELDQAITTIDNGDGTRSVGPVGVDHALFPEFGTEYMPAQPYVTPAAEAERQRFEGRVATEVEKRLR